MTDQTNATLKLNSDGILKAVAIAMMHVGKLDAEQRGDVILAALDALKTSLVDDITHNVGIGVVSDSEVVARIAGLGIDMEEIRKQRIDRFANLCELLKPEVNIVLQYNDKRETKH